MLLVLVTLLTVQAFAAESDRVLERAKLIGIGKHALRSGPNCFNYAQYLLGLTDSIHYTSTEEMDLLLKSSFCRRVPVGKANLAAIRTPDEHDLLHVYIPLSGGEVLSKTSFWREFPFERVPYAEMAKWFRPKEYCSKCRNETEFYLCRKPEVNASFPMEILAAIAELERKLHRFSLEIPASEADKVEFQKMNAVALKLSSRLKDIAAPAADEFGRWTELKVESLRQNLERWIYPDEDD